ncbi:MAG: cold shock protein [Acidimicrobiaceae bacterium]|nr:cold shock protein [Acidimicrobiaceae bacterium]
MQSGRVARFDDAAGLGDIEADDGTRYPFHCTQIADGTRTIEQDTPVTFEVVAGHMGRWEATRIASAPPTSP